MAGRRSALGRPKRYGVQPPTRSTDETQTTFLAGFVAATLAYNFTVLSFTGRLSLVELAVFAAYFLVAATGFAYLFRWGLTDD